MTPGDRFVEQLAPTGDFCFAILPASVSDTSTAQEELAKLLRLHRPKARNGPRVRNESRVRRKVAIKARHADTKHYSLLVTSTQTFFGCGKNPPNIGTKSGQNIAESCRPSLAGQSLAINSLDPWIRGFCRRALIERFADGNLRSLAIRELSRKLLFIG
jgi:hypothetical protein